MSGTEERPGTGDDAVELLRSEEELRTRREPRQRGRVRVRKVVEEDRAERSVERSVQHAALRREPPYEDDSGEVVTLADGSLSIPLLAEELVVEKRLVVVERLVVGKEAVVEERPVSAVLRRERVEVDTSTPPPPS